MEKVATALSKKELDSLSVGLFMMTVFTSIWVFIAEVALAERDHGAAGGAFGIIIVFFIINYIRLTKTAKEMGEASKEADEPMEKSRAKRFYSIFAVEGIAILVMKNVLANTGHDNLFISFFALIVGLHFFPMAIVLKRPFFYVIGAWICLMSAIGFMLIYRGVETYIPAAIIGLGCALATTPNGIRIIKQGGVAWLGGM